MPKPTNFSYNKKAPFRDAFLFIIVCEGTNREIDYFKFFDGISSRLILVPITNYDGSSPNLLIETATNKEESISLDQRIDQLWFVIDTDRWKTHLHTIRQVCSEKHNWNVVQSNPCFEVWLYYHAKNTVPNLENIDKCKSWKPYLPTIIAGGFNSDYHPVAIDVAVANSKAVYQENGFFPEPGHTQVWQLGEELLKLIWKDLNVLKTKFSVPNL